MTERDSNKVMIAQTKGEIVLLFPVYNRLIASRRKPYLGRNKCLGQRDLTRRKSIVFIAEP